MRFLCIPLLVFFCNPIFSQNKFINKIEDIVFSGDSEKISLYDDFGDVIIKNGKEISIPKHSVKFIIKENQKLLLKVTGDNRNNTFEGDFLIEEESEEKIRITSLITQSNSNNDSIDINHPLYSPENKLELEITPKNVGLELSFNSLPSIILSSSNPKVKEIIDELNKVKVTEKSESFDNNIKTTTFNTKDDVIVKGTIKIFKGIAKYYILNLSFENNSDKDYYIDNSAVSYATISKKPSSGKALSREQFDNKEKKAAQRNSLLSGALKQSGIGSIVNKSLKDAGINKNINKDLGLNKSPSSSSDSYLQRLQINANSSEIIQKYILAEFDKNTSKIMFQVLFNGEKLIFDENQTSLKTIN